MNPVAAIEPSAQARAAGRPRSEGCRQKILAAADALVARDGFAKMSVDAIAQAAGASKATIYRWWPNKAAIVMEALLESTEADVHVPATVNPGDDVVTKIRRTIAVFRGPKGRVFASLIGEAQFDPELAVAYRRQLIAPRRAGLREVLERAVAAGQIRADIDFDLAIDLLYGPIYERILLGHAPLDEAFERDYPAIAWAALRGYAGVAAEP